MFVIDYLHNTWLVASISLAYIGLLFAVAIYGNKNSTPKWQPYIYSLTLAIFCTSWAYYGVVQQSIKTGWLLAPTYFGAILLMTFGWKIMKRIITLAKRENSTTIADFMASRYGHSRGIAILVTLFCLFGMLPYIALQLKAVSGSFQLITQSNHSQPSWFNDPALVIALLMAVFSILFGTRSIDSSESNRGMMLAIAFESIVKLTAFLAVGIFAIYGYYDGFTDLYNKALQEPRLMEVLTDYSNPSVYFTHAMIGAIAIFALPRQFHVAVVESTSSKDLKTARWMFPLYLLLINLFVLPLAVFSFLQRQDFPSLEYITLQIPLVYEQSWLACLSYLGGLSAGTSMVIITSITLATMICNEIVLPFFIRINFQANNEPLQLKRRVLRIRRVAIICILFMAFLYYRVLSRYNSLSEIGLLSFVAIAQFAPAILIGLIWQGANHRGAYCGLITGFIVWFYCLFMPVLADAGWITGEIMLGPWGIEFLRPYELFGFNGLDHIVHGTFWSLLLNTIALVVGSLYYKPSFSETEQAQRFMLVDNPYVRSENHRYSISIFDLKALLARFINEEKVESLFSQYSNPITGRIINTTKVDESTLKSADRLLSSVLGRKGANLLIGKLVNGNVDYSSNLSHMMEEVSEAVTFNRELLTSALQNINQGISIIDERMNLIVWNNKFTSLYGIPDSFLYAGVSIEKVIQFIGQSGGFGDLNIDELMVQRIDEIRSGSAHYSVRKTNDGRYIELQGNAMGEGRYVTTYTDITSHRIIQDKLTRTNEILEQRVQSRTQALTEVNESLHKANSNKTRFLASAGHDLVQPLNSASLFSASILQKLARLDSTDNGSKESLIKVASNLEKSLNSAEFLLNELLEISKLDADIIKANIEVLPINKVLAPLYEEFSSLATKKGLTLKLVRSEVYIRSDAMLLRRVIQNLLSNALRYTFAGQVTIGVRDTKQTAWIEIHDSGIGLPADQTESIFDEFHRLDSTMHVNEKGLGLGLSIVQRICLLLDHDIVVESKLGQGSCFSINVPMVRGEKSVTTLRPKPLEMNHHKGQLILCIDNEQQVINGMSSLLDDWGFEVLAASSEHQARGLLANKVPSMIPNLIIVDYHLDSKVTGLHVIKNMQRNWNKKVPCLVITADYTEEVKKEIESQGYQQLRKPVKPMALRSLINKLLI